MSDELQAEVDRLRAEVAKLTKDAEHAAFELKETRAEARDKRHENKALAAQLEAAAKERDAFRAKAEIDPDDLRREVETHRATVRAMKHDRAFEKVAKALKVNDPSKLRDLVDLAKYAPEGDEPDEARIAATFQEALKGRPWLVDATAPAATPAAAPGGATTAPGGAVPATIPAPAVPGPGSDRGQSVSSTASQPAGRPFGKL